MAEMWQKVTEFVKPYLSDAMEFMVDVAIMFVYFAIAYAIISQLMKFFLTQVRKLIERTKTTLDDMILASIQKPFERLSIIIAGLIALNFTPFSPYIRSQILPTVNRLVEALGIIVLAMGLNRVIRVVLDWYMDRVAVRTETKLDDTLVPLLRKLSVVIVYGVALVNIVKIFGGDISAIITAFGVGSFAVAFAAQTTLSNMIAGMVLIFDRPFRIGDMIELPNGEYGTVSDIGIRSTKILTTSKITVIFPNSQLVSGVIRNLSYPTEVVRVRIDVGVAYGSDVELVERKVLEACRDIPEILDDPPPMVYFVGFGDSSLDFRLYAHINSYRNRLATISRIHERINELFNESGINIPFPHRELIVKNPEELAGAFRPTE